jgi:hypothetical protein
MVDQIGRQASRMSAATARAFRLFGKLGPEQLAADVEAVDAGVTLRLSCAVRATYGDYPRSFRTQMVELTPEGIVVRPYWFSLNRKTYRMREEAFEAAVRPRDAKIDWNLRATGAYGEHGYLSHIGRVVVSCRTGLGQIEFAVVRPDAPLVLHYLKRRIGSS